MRTVRQMRARACVRVRADRARPHVCIEEARNVLYTCRRTLHIVLCASRAHVEVEGEGGGFA